MLSTCRRNRIIRTWSRRRRTAAIAGCAVALVLGAAVEAGGRKSSRRPASAPAGGLRIERADGAQSMIARQPDHVAIPGAAPEEIAAWDDASRTAAARRIAMRFLDEADATTGRWQILEIAGAPLRFSELAPDSQREISATYGLEAARRYNASIADLLEEAVALIDRRRPGIALTVLGLPIEAGRESADAARIANELFAPVLARLDAFATSRSFIRLGAPTNGPAVRVDATLPEAERLRGARPILYRLNRVWHIATPSPEAIARVEAEAEAAAALVAAQAEAVAEAPDPARTVAPEAPRRATPEPAPSPAPPPAAAPRRAAAAAPPPAPEPDRDAPPPAFAPVLRADEDVRDAAAPDEASGRRRARPRVRVTEDQRLERVEGVRVGMHDGRLQDCNGNGLDDIAEIESGTAKDCDGNWVPDDCETLPDADGDGTPDCDDGCPNDPGKRAPGACGCGEPDLDTDGDGVPDCVDGCPEDPTKGKPGTCGCGTPDLDTDGDGVPDCVDGCPEDPEKTVAGDCGCGVPETAGCLGAPILEPGSGFGGPTSVGPAVGDPTDPSWDCRAIARWDVVPYRTVSDHLDLGVVAFHAAGIDRVEFALDGGPWIAAQRMSENPRTGVREYWARFDATTVADGPHEVRAIAWPNVGEPMLLESLPLFANAGGTLPVERLHVAPFGSDGGGDGSMDYPYRTIRRALDHARGDLARHDGGEIVLLAPGEYDVDTPGQAVMNERWITIRPVEGLARDEVVIAAGAWELVRPKTRRLRFAGLSLDFSRTMQMYKEDDHRQWYDGCRWFQSQGWTHATSPFLQPVRNVGYRGLYVTESIAEDTIYGFVGCNLVRNCRVERISGDCFQNSLAVIRCTARTVDGTVLDHHSDLLQYFGHHERLIVYGLKATGVRATQNFFLDWNDSSFTDCAFVNVVVENSLSNPPFSQLHSRHKHVLFAHVSNPGQNWVFRDDVDEDRRFVGEDVHFTNCALERLSRGTWGVLGLPEGVQVDHCHLIAGELHGALPTTGPLDVIDGPGWSFEIGGGGAGQLASSGVAIPGLVTGSGEGAFAAPDRRPWPALADAGGGGFDE